MLAVGLQMPLGISSLLTRQAKEEKDLKFTNGLQLPLSLPVKLP